jgi:hypothetical protein
MMAIRKKDSTKILYYLVAVDFGFLFLAVLQRRTLYFSDPHFNLTMDESFAEFYQYFKEIFIALTCARISQVRRLPVYLVWSGLFTYFFMDDAFRIHENLGKLIAKTFGFASAFGLRAQDFGELAVFGFFGLLFFLLILFSFLHCDRNHRKIWQHLMLLIILLVICGIGFDMIHSIFSDKSFAIGPITLSSIFGVIEDFGEMIVMSLCTWYVVNLFRKEKEGLIFIKGDYKLLGKAF